MHMHKIMVSRVVSSTGNDNWPVSVETLSVFF